MGKVNCATDTRLNRKVAVKTTTENFRERFEREGLELLQHSIMPVSARRSPLRS